MLQMEGDNGPSCGDASLSRPALRQDGFPLDSLHHPCLALAPEPRRPDDEREQVRRCLGVAERLLACPAPVDMPVDLRRFVRW